MEDLIVSLNRILTVFLVICCIFNICLPSYVKSEELSINAYSVDLVSNMTNAKKLTIYKSSEEYFINIDDLEPIQQ